MTNNELVNFISSTPSNSGIYIFKEGSGKLYIGKAGNLKARLRSYLKTTDPRIQKMVSVANDLELIVTESDIEALILESQMVKGFQPQFNIMLRDDKQYFFVGFTRLGVGSRALAGNSVDDMRRIYLTHQPVGSDEFIGPFTDGAAIKATLRLLRSVFPYCTCKQLHHNRCLNYHIGKCPGFCCLKSEASSKEKKAYAGNIKAVREILNGRKNSLVKELKKNADNSARNDDFEKAIELRGKIEKLERIFENARIIRSSEILKSHRSGLGALLKIRGALIRIEGYDVSNIQGAYATGSMVTFISGQPDKNFYRKFKIFRKKTSDDIAMLREVLERRFKHDEWPFPNLVLIDGGKGQVNAAAKVMKGLRINIPVVGVSKDDRHVGHQLVIPGRKLPLALNKLSQYDRNLILAIDAEAHRFAIAYYRKLHRRNLKAAF